MSPVDLVYPIAIGLAEGGWVAVLYLLVDAIARAGPSLSAIVFGLAAGGCCLAANRLDRLAPSRIAVVVGLLVGGGIVGVGLASVAGLAIGGRSLLDALTGDPGAVLVGLAALRGFIRAGALHDPGQAARPFFVGLVGLTAAWIFGGALNEPMRSSFREAAIVPTLAFVAGSVAATGLASAAYAATDADYDPRANRPWLVALIGVALALGLAALPIGQGLERVMAALIAWPLTLPIVIVAAIVARILVPSRSGALRRAGAFTFGPLILLGVLAVLAAVLPHNAINPATEGAGAISAPDSETTSPAVGIAMSAAALAVVIAVLLFLARAWRRNAGVSRGGLAFERHRYDLGRGERTDEGGSWLGDRIRRLVRRGRPADAVAAYLAVLRWLEPDEGLRRDPAETPAVHARRLRDAGAGGLDLDLLAADFALARWGGRKLSPAEDRRAVGRWDQLRGRLAGRVSEGPTDASADG